MAEIDTDTETRLSKYKGYGTVRVLRNGKYVTLDEAKRIDTATPKWKLWLYPFLGMMRFDKD